MKITFRGLTSFVVVLALNLTFLGVNSLESDSESVIVDLDQNDHVTETKNLHETEIHTAGSTEIHSSFSEEVSTEKIPAPKSRIEEGSILKNIQVAPELSETADAVVFTLVDTAAELRNRAESQLQNDLSNETNQAHSSFEAPEEVYIVHAEPKTQVETTTEEIIEKEVNQSQIITTSSQEEPTKTAPTQHEDIPSFREWTQKQLAEAEKKKVDPNVTADKVTKSSGKFRLKNYASPDCGAKIVAANPESVSSSSVLSSSKDEYMLNYCTSRIWFIVELCESIRAKQLDLANFELFSSSPKHFTVSISHRYPTRDWSNVGKFTAKDSRDVQTFDLSPQLFGKYIKIELRSHYGKEHFCPVSWVGVYGTSEYEILAKEDDRHLQPDEDDDDDDEDVAEIRRDVPKNLFSSATDAVLSIVKKATAPFMKVENNETSVVNQENSTISSSRCMTPRYITVCDNCTQNFYDDVYFLLSCKNFNLRDLISSGFVRRILIHYENCNRYGLDFTSLRIGAPFPKIKNPSKENYLTSILKDSYVAALCNFVAVSENKVVVNASVDMIETLKNLTEKKESCESSVIFPSSTCSINCRSSVTEYSSSISDTFKSTERSSEKIEPTRTLTEDEAKKLSASETNPIVEQSKQTETKPVVSATATVEPEKPETPEEIPKVAFVENIENIEKIEDIEIALPPQDTTLDSIFSDINEFEKAVKSNPSSATLPPPTHLPTESIFLRLANRIKNLEINMSLSSLYLEEMSRRYRNQLEVLSKTVNLTAQKIEEQYKLEEEREKRREREISLMRQQLANLTRDVTMLLKEKNSWKILNSLVSIILIALITSLILITYSRYQKIPPKKPKPEIPYKKPKQKTKRRNSVEGIPIKETHQYQRVRRPSDEALEIALASKFEKKRKRKKKDSKASLLIKRKKSENSNTSSDDKNLEDKTDKLEIIKTTLVEHGEVEMTNRFAPIFSSPQSKRSDPEFYYNGLANEPVRRFSSPVFMKTALSSRNSRLRSTQSERESSQESSVSSKLDEATNSNDARKEKKSTGIKKYMKKFF